MGWGGKREIVEDLVIIGGLIGVQFVYAGNSVLLSYLMSLGLNPLSLIIFSTFATFLLLSPISLVFERSPSFFFWPLVIIIFTLILVILLDEMGIESHRKNRNPEACI